ncbi:MAG TPA: AMP-binding protein [Candidatus Cloacimonadota bacterium]|nr:AMP-binding protein [Candidatus Cloacimonadota bacterium]HOD53834.1 AMP-binding protein [Candidatus Cloacimonadota bacterium]HPM01152.1 AMP-binding protein [Candidatus Cloacimonadota bacterium]
MIKENFVEYFEQKIKEFWNLPALSNYEKESISYQDLAFAIKTMHQIFEKLKIKNEDKIALIGKNCVNWGIVYLSTVTYGATIVPILNNFSNEDLHHILNHSESKLIFVSDKLTEEIDIDQLKFCDTLFSLNNFTIVESKKNNNINEFLTKLLQLNCHDYFNQDDFKFSKKVPNTQLAALLYTSGTTGFSKGVMLTYNSLIANILVASKRLLFKKEANMVSFLPLAHAYACSFDFLYPLTCGNHIHFLDKTPTPKILLEAFKKYQPHIILCVPLIIEKIYRKMIYPELQKPAIQILLKFSLTRKILFKKIHNSLMNAFGGRLDELVVGGAAMNKEVESFLRNIGFPFTIGYGMTECGPLISYANWHKTKLGSSGQVVDYLEMKIDSTNPYKITGEIMVKGEQVTIGYFKNQSATDDVIDSEGWLKTGDLGIMDSENFVFIKGRSKNVIIGASGENIYPEEIEQKINNMQFIMESLVIEKNNNLLALIYPDLEEIDKHQIKDNKIEEIMKKNKQIINDQLPAHSKIKEFKLVNEPFQKTPTQKIKRYLYVN